MTINQTTTQASPGEEGEKLAAIMFTDIVGYSKKMHENETLMLELREEHYGILRGIFNNYGGREIETTGDGFLIVFDSAVKAMQAALNIQASLHERNIQEPLERHVQARIGLHLGGVVFKEGRVSGDTVNITMRVLQFANPEGISLTEGVALQTLFKMKEKIIKLGRVRLKNISTPIMLCRVVMPWEESVRERRERWAFYAKRHQRQIMISAMLLTIAGGYIGWKIISPPPIFENKKISVLPLQLFGENKENEFLTEGFARVLNRELHNMKEMTVISNTSAFSYKGSTKSDSVIADELGVDYLLKGSLRSTSNIIKFDFSLFDGRSNKLVWHGTYNEQASNILANVQEAVLAATARILGREYSPDKQFERANTLNAYMPYVEGTYYVGKYPQTASDNEIAMQKFSDAISKDSDFDDAYASLAEAQIFHIINEYTNQPSVLALAAKKNVRKSLALNPNNALALAITGRIFLGIDNKIDSAQFYYDKALSIDHNNFLALADIAGMNLYTQPHISVSKYLEAIRIEPRLAELRSGLGAAYGNLRQYANAIEAFKQALQLKPSLKEVWINLGVMSQLQENYVQSLRYCMTALEKDSSSVQAYETLVASAVPIKSFALAESVLAKGLHDNPTKYELMYLMGQTMLFHRKAPQAQSYFAEGSRWVEQRIQGDPENPKLLSIAALFYARLRQIDRAYSSANIAARFGSDLEDISARLANVYAILDQRDSVIRWFSNAKRNEPFQYNLDYLKTAWDLGKYQTDPKIEDIAKQQPPQ